MKTTNVLFEVGLEEMPARFMNNTEQQLLENTKNWLEDIRLPYEQITTYITPRRFAVLIEGLTAKQADQEEEAKGPAEKIAVDEDGNWTKAAIGFSKGQGKNVDDIYFKDLNGTRYAYVKKFQEGEAAEKLLSGFKDIIVGLNFPKNMRWSDQTIKYIRPIKWLLALQDNEVIPFEIAGVETGNTTHGHRFLGEQVVINDPLKYEQLLREQYVIASTAEREGMIQEGIRQLSEEHNWVVPMDDELLTEVTHLVEYPTVFYGTFSESFLHIPKEVLITSMKEHQRYFPVQSKDGELYPYFIAVRNGTSDHIENVSKGNEKVLRARLQDAQFFYEEDQKQPIEKNLAQLDRMVFQEQLGTIKDKVNRVVEISKLIANKLNLTEKEGNQIIRAAQISKFDLVTNMVNEFTELQGIMGRKYATIFGEDEAVAQAIEEHYMPVSANAPLPKSTVGSVVSVADKLDTIVGCFAVGLRPSGSQDPYALRRQALGIIQIMESKQWKVNLSQFIGEVLSLFVDKEMLTEDKKAAFEQLEIFFKQRAAYIMKEENIEHDIVDAVLIGQIEDVSFMKAKAKLLAKKRYDSHFKDNQEALVRIMNLANKHEGEAEVDESKFVNAEERDLYTAYLNIKSDYKKALDHHEEEKALHILSSLSAPIHAFFDHTMVMDKDQDIRENRLALLRFIANDITQFADLSKIQWKQHQV
ncbi:glycine--tRNA ligase subunit beta [Gracilibacillus sp. YIM 98692]|uniref:glycine--tRNA ligase subunit beta n=1 Tax=Gracilibacillus sp. YIM 98692 TaxID=2663532 RepID=UPI0013D25150|nr:glycine--tRNA ligase subunit beta [Gracilibacillus sp. YIM 98692]